MRKKREAQPAEKPAAKPEVKPKPAAKTANPSEKLALLLRKEGMLAVRARKAQMELRAAQAEISKLWEQRAEVNRDLLSDTPEA